MWALGRKAQGHEEMLRQFAAFDIRNCKCSDESDRQPLEALVAGLFTEDDVASVSIEVAGSISDSSESTTSVSEEWHGSYRSLVRCGSLSADEGPGPLSQEPRKEGSGGDSGLEAFNAYVRGVEFGAGFWVTCLTLAMMADDGDDVDHEVATMADAREQL